MPSCDVCQEFVTRRKKILQDISKLSYTKDEKERIYYDDKVDDNEFENGVKVCEECFDQVCRRMQSTSFFQRSSLGRMSKNENIDCETIKHFLTMQAPIERKNRKLRKSKPEMTKRFANVQSELLEYEPSCKACRYFNNKRSNLNKLSDQELEQENVSCGKCLQLCQEKELNVEYCRRTRAQKEVSDMDKDKRRLLNLEKLYNIQKIQRELGSKKK